jgi:hypothetical protein
VAAGAAGAFVAAGGVDEPEQEAMVNKQTNTKSSEIMRFIQVFLLKLFGILIIATRSCRVVKNPTLFFQNYLGII